MLAGYAVVQTYRDGSVHWLDAICGLCLYASGRDAACKATIEGKIEATKKHANALTIEKLIEQYATDQQPLFALKPSTKCV